MINNKNMIQFLSLILIMVLFIGCSSTRKPISLSDAFNQQKIGVIKVLPCADLRFNKEDPLPKLDKWVHSILKTNLNRLDYEYEFETNRSLIETIDDENLEKQNVEWIKGLNRFGNRWILLIGLLDVQASLTFGSTGNAEVIGYFFDTHTGTLLWYDKNAINKGVGGLVGMALHGLMKGDAIITTVHGMMKSFPKNQFNN